MSTPAEPLTVAFWMSDSDEAIADARDAGGETVVGLRYAPRRAGPARDVLTASWRHAVR